MSDSIGTPVIKKDHCDKISGRALYTDDRPMDGVLYGRILRSKKARARIVDIHLPTLPEGYYIINRDDVPGVNRVHIVKDDCPVFADDTVEYIGEAILMVAGPDKKETGRIRDSIEVEYEELEPVLDVLKSEECFFEYGCSRGDLDAELE